MNLNFIRTDNVKDYFFNFLVLVIFLLLICCNRNIETDLKEEQFTDKVYPLLDSENSRWFFFSSASRPFGMVNLSPDTEVNGAWGSGYCYKTDTIKGFSHIHAWQLSGLSLMPVTVDLKNKNNIFRDYYSGFSHVKEQITPGYHSVELDRYKIKVELTSTKRVGFHRYCVPQKEDVGVLLNLNTFLGPCENTDGILQQVGKNELKGKLVAVQTHRRPKPLHVYFNIRLNTPILEINKDYKTGNYLILLEKGHEEILLKAGISYTSHQNARNNIERELPHWNFNQIIDDSKKEWNDLLGRIEVEGGSEKDQQRFYTDLWHALQGRRIISDANGAYPDNTKEQFRIGQLPVNDEGVPLFNHYNSDSFWGAQWTINTLWGLVYPEIMHEFTGSLMQYYKDGGMIPRGPSGGNYTYVMTGASSTPFIVSAIQKGIVKEHIDSIYLALKRNHMPGGIMEKAGYEHLTSLGGGFNYYLKEGFVPYPLPEGEFGGHQEGASLTLEYAYQDWTLAQLAKKVGQEDEYNYFLKRSKNYKILYDKHSGWIRPKSIDGYWLHNFDPYQYQNGFIESNGAQFTWFVPHDMKGLARLMGGNQRAVDKLNTQFIEAEKLGFTSGNSHAAEKHPEYSRIPVNYGNQPSIQTTFIFQQLDRPDLTQYWSRKVVDQVFSGLETSTGYNGDEDQGLMGSLAVLMKMGLFQMNGGTEENPSYQIGSPIFDKVTIHLNSNYYPGETFQIKASNNSEENIYVKKAYLNSKPLSTYEISHSDIINGGELKLEMFND
ncbi:GH92 family glycosyl hydrolase [Aestuariibaculum suncheonense]|uniref:Glycoside hydrolase family 92 protein n=1 Tax=Aestuariibaculum suncheonense TaxID=1028745 RepID=A0A8J6UJU1_9FLAO|nr:GH92 family glycosyl hydrolase [Aestuariibaculum suncheonense]MBD0835081.1 glycoside hydrolase family 92 protein [Aestuariibaculum suncheonense]